MLVCMPVYSSYICMGVCTMRILWVYVFMTSRNDNALSVTSIQTQGYFYTKTHVFLALVPKPQVSLVAALTEMKKKDLFSFTVIFI